MVVVVVGKAYMNECAAYVCLIGRDPKLTVSRKLFIFRSHAKILRPHVSLPEPRSVTRIGLYVCVIARCALSQASAKVNGKSENLRPCPFQTKRL